MLSWLLGVVFIRCLLTATLAVAHVLTTSLLPVKVIVRPWAVAGHRSIEPIPNEPTEVTKCDLTVFSHDPTLVTLHPLQIIVRYPTTSAVAPAAAIFVPSLAYVVCTVLSILSAVLRRIPSHTSSSRWFRDHVTLK